MNVKIGIIITTLLLLTSFLHAQDDKVAPKYSKEFLHIGEGADALGMSNAVVAITDYVNA